MLSSEQKIVERLQMGRKGKKTSLDFYNEKVTMSI